MNRSWSWQLHNFRKKRALLDSHSNSTDNLTLKPVDMAMDPTTLVTFLFKAPPEARTIELLGSWDNFSQPYTMQQDRRRGRGFWTGCFKFQNIIFDGDRTNPTKPRTGGLKQGGTYWYFYRLDDETEMYDDSQSYTSACPLLPGQGVNVIEVPIEVQERPARCRSASFDVADSLSTRPDSHTLDPKDKFAALEPPPVSKVHGRCLSDLELNGRLEGQTKPFIDPFMSPPDSPALSDHGSLTSPSEGCFSDRPSSIDSQRSRRSTAPSIAHSSVYDAYRTDTRDDREASGLEPVWEMSSHSSHGGVHYEEDIRIESRRADYDSSSNDDTIFPTSASLQDSHSYDLRPATSHSNAPWSRCEHGDYFEDNWDFTASPQQSPHDPSPPDFSPPYSSPRHSHHGDTAPSGMTSPTSIATGCRTHKPSSCDEHAALESVAERIRALSQQHSPALSIPTPIYEEEAEQQPGAFACYYALPHDAATTQQQQSLAGKFSSGAATTTTTQTSVVTVAEQDTIPS